MTTTRIYPNLSYLADENGHLRIELLPINDTGASQTELWSAYKTYARIQELQSEVDAISGGGAGVGISDGTVSNSTTWSSVKISAELLLKEDPANKNQIEGYPGLDEFGLIYLSVIPNIPTNKITGFDVAVNNHTLVAANTAKVTNATHTGDVTGNLVLTISDNAVTLSKLVDFSESTILGRISPGTGNPEILTSVQARNLLNVQDGATANNTNAFLLSRTNHIGSQAATTVLYDNTVSGLTSTDVQGALDELGTDLVIGVDVQAYSAELDAIAQLNSATNTLSYFTGVGTAGITPFTPFARTLLDDTDALTVKTTIGLENVDNISDANKPVSIATQSALDGKQPLNGDLTALSGVTSLADTLFYFTGSQTGNVTTLTPFARTFLDDVDAPTVRTTLGLGTASLLDAGAINGVATLDGTGKVFTSQLPSYVDDVLEYADFASLPVTGEASKVYVTLGNNLTYRWSGSAYVEISPSLALGTTPSTAYRGDYGNTAYTHSLLTTGNPHAVTSSDVGLANVDNTSDLSKPISTATQTALDNKQALDTELTAIAGLASSANQLPLFTGSGTASLLPVSTYAQGLLNDVDASTMRTSLKAIGSDATGITGASEISNIVALTQANYDAIVTPDAGTIYNVTDAATLDLAGNTTISTFGSTLVDDTDAAAAKTTLGIAFGIDAGTFAEGSNFVPKGGGTFTGGLNVNGQINPGYQATTNDAAIELGNLRTGDGNAYIDFHAAPGIDHSGRIIRRSGENGIFELAQAGTGVLRLSPGTGGLQVGTVDITPEEGTFTPTVAGATIAGTGTYSKQVGIYRKIGKTVYVSIRLAWSAHTGTGDMRINGLPFASENVTDFLQSLDVAAPVGLAVPTDHLPYAVIFPNSSYIVMVSRPTTGGSLAQDSMSLDTSVTDLILCGVYISD